MNLKDAEKRPATAARTSKPAPAWLGRRIGRFKLVALLGQGAMGKVFRAEDVSLQRQVALKVLPLQRKVGDKTIGLEQLVREARSAAAIDHPGVVQVYEVNQTSEIFYIAMELLEGRNLRELVLAGGPMDIIRACQLGAEAAEALGHAHQLGIVHRDVKPSNLMLSRAGRCKLMDFGLARIDDPNDSFYLGTEAVGTPLYMAPEVARGQRAGAASDIYSLAATVCFLLCGRPPFQARTAGEIIEKHASEPPPDLSELRPDLPRGLADSIAKGLAKSPKERFATAEQFASALRVHTIPVGASGAVGSGSWAAGSGMSAPKPARSWRLGRGLWIGLGATLLLVCGGVAYLMFGSTPHTLPPTTLAPQPESPAASAQVSATSGGVAESPASLPAADNTALLAIVDDPKNPLAGKPVSVVGVVKKSHFTSSGNLRLTFEGADEETGFQIFCPVAVLKEMEHQFGGSDGAGIIGHKVAVDGVVSLYKGRPQIRIESAGQIHVQK